MKNPQCPSCNIKFPNWVDLNTHMALKHQETDSMRVERLTSMVDAVVNNTSEKKVLREATGKVFDCSECGILMGTSEEMKEHIKKKHTIKSDSHVSSVIENIIDNVIDLSETENDSSEEDGGSDEEDEEINIEYDYSYEEESSAEAYKGKKPLFVQAVKALKDVIKEKGDSHGKRINKYRMVIKDVRNISYGIEADVEIQTEKNKGLAKVKIWGPSKSAKQKHKCSINITKYPHYDGKWVKILSRKIIKPLLDSFLRGEGWKAVMKKEKISNERVPCNECDKSFGKRYIDTHREKMHNLRCNICDIKFVGGIKLKSHMTEAHSKAAIEITKEVIEDNQDPTVLKPKNIDLQRSFNCSQCSVGFKEKIELFEHNENVHIHDNWPDSGSKRTVSMVKTSSILEPKKKKAAEDSEMKTRSDEMDRKVLEKRKKDELDDVLSKKLIEEKKIQEEIKANCEKKKRNRKEKAKKHKESDRSVKTNNTTKTPIQC